MDGVFNLSPSHTVEADIAYVTENLQSEKPLYFDVGGGINVYLPISNIGNGFCFDGIIGITGAPGVFMYINTNPKNRETMVHMLTYGNEKLMDFKLDELDVALDFLESSHVSFETGGSKSLLDILKIERS